MNICSLYLQNSLQIFRIEIKDVKEQNRVEF